MKSWIRLSMFALLLSVLSLAVPGAAQAASTPGALVSSSTLNVREGPGTGYAILDAVHAGDELPVTGRSASGWLQVSLANGQSGWVSGEYVVTVGDLTGTPEVASPAANAATTTSTASKASSPRSGGVIVFQISSGGPIYAVNSDGSNLRYLTTGMDPALSPDGSQVAFTRWQGSTNGVSGSVWVINVDGSGERQVLAGANQAKSPTWSANGEQIVISVQQGGTLSDTYLCMVGGKATQVTEPIAGQRCMPQAANPYWGLRLVNVATGSYEDLPRETHSFAPTWDPANAWHVVFRGDQGLVSLDINQKTTSVLASNGAYRGPVFSPGGSKIAVTFKQNDHWEIHVLNADGSGEVRLTETPETVIVDQILAGQTVVQWNNAAPAWSPDGSQIAFITDRNGAYEIWVMNADGSNQHPLLSSTALAGLNIQYNGVDERVISWR